MRTSARRRASASRALASETTSKEMSTTDSTASSRHFFVPLS
jgi:hypothetical protein